MTATDANTLARVEPLPLDRGEEAVDVLAEAFHDYPVMRHIIGAANGDYDEFLHKLIRLFVAARYSKEEPVLAVSDSEHALAVAILTPPDAREAPRSLKEHREALWRELGPEARQRYEALGEIWARFSIPEPHYHLNMIGVVSAVAGGGLGRRLLDAIHDMSYSDRGSSGVSLNTEDENNVPLYEHFGYETVGHARIGDELDTWVMFRPDEKGRVRL